MVLGSDFYDLGEMSDCDHDGVVAVAFDVGDDGDAVVVVVAVADYDARQDEHDVPLLGDVDDNLAWKTTFADVSHDHCCGATSHDFVLNGHMTRCESLY